MLQNTEEIVAVATGMITVGTIAALAYQKGRRDEATLQAMELPQQAISLMLLMVLQPIIDEESKELRYTFRTYFGTPLRMAISKRVAKERYGLTVDKERTFQVHVHCGKVSAYVGTTLFRDKATHLWGGSNVETSL
jgi:hypothetical protein